MTPLQRLSRAARAHADLQPVPFRVERFEYVPGDLLLRLSVRLALEPPGHAHPMLFVEREAVEHAYEPLVSCTARPTLEDACEWLWRAAFAVPSDLACDSRALFAVAWYDELLLALPAPSERVLDGQPPSSREPKVRKWPYALRLGALPFVITCQLCLAPGLAPVPALADGSAGAGAGSEPTPETPSPPPAGSPSEPTPETTPEATPSEPAGGSGGPAAEAPLTNGATSQSSTTAATAPAPSSTSTVKPAAIPAPARSPKPVTPAAPTLVTQLRQKASAAGKVGPTAPKPQPSPMGVQGSAAGLAAGSNNVALPPQVAAAEAAALAAEFAGSATSTQALAYYRIPLFLLPIYRAAAVQYGVPWPILAAINEIETNYGSDLSISTAGAVGWMQFMPATWIQYGVDALNAGYADPYNPVDAIFAAARYLRAAGASTNLHAAILAYNHSEGYASSVLLRAKLISAYPKQVIGTLTGLIDAGLPVTGSTLTWEMLAPAASSSSAAGHGKTLPSKSVADASATVKPGSSAPPSPTAAAAAVTVAHGAAAQAPRLIDLRTAPNAAAVTVQDGRITQLGSSRELGKYVILRDIYGDTFIYAGLGSIARSYRLPNGAATPVTAPPGGGDRRSGGSGHARPLRVGSVVAKGTVLGHVRVPPGATDGHLRFAIRPAGDPNTIDPTPILGNWKQLNAALHPQGASGESKLLGATPTATTTAHSSSTGRAARLRFALGAQLTAGQWDHLIAQIAALPVPKVASAPSSAAIPDPQATSHK